MSIFRAYDIRGRYPSEIDEDISYKIALAYAAYLKPKTVVIGMDLRSGSKKIHDAFVRGLRDSGVDVTSIGACTSPMLYFASFYYKFDGAAMITASHLGAAFNGIKLCRKDAVSLSGPKGIYGIEKMVEKPFFVLADKKGKFKRKSIERDYHAFMGKFAKKTDFKVLVNCGNGMGYLNVAFLKKLAKVTVMHEKPDFTFPNHPCDPTDKEAQAQTIKRMERGRYDFGLIFDGDCDRVGFVDEKSRFIPMDHTTGVIAEYILKHSRKTKDKPKILHEVRTSKSVDEMISKDGGKPVLCRVGHSFITQHMREDNAIFGGEKSGHYFFKETHYAESSLLAVITVLKYMQESGKPISELAEPFNRYFQLKQMNFRVKDQDLMLKKVEARFRKKARRIRKVDGISVYLQKGWFNLRKSNTEPVIRLSAEAETKKDLKDIADNVKRIIKK